MSTALHLTFKEIWRNRGRFLLFSLVIALITVLILFIAALGEGLGSGNREYIEKLNADILVYQDIAQLSIAGSTLDRATLRAINNVEGVKAAGPVSFASVSIPIGEAKDPLDVSLIGVEPGMPGEPPAIQGEGLLRRSSDDAIIDETVAMVANLNIGDWFAIRTPQGNKAEFYALRVAGITTSQKYSIRPSIFVPLVTWDTLRPQASTRRSVEDLTGNIIAVQLENPWDFDRVQERIETQVGRVEAVDRKTAYESTPGYTAQQSTLATQNGFALLIGVLVIGGFFQIQTLQKVAQIGMLKAIGTPSRVVAIAILLQIIAINIVGVLIGSFLTVLVASGFPPNIPIIFELRSGAIAVGSILLMGPLGGLVSIRYALQVEPLTALKLA
ncbi:MAG: ABC transporter permease [Anaerolineae bacterium]|jgi:putative ABC transport system permease protein|nr:ABC transporter permease [Anaerolineae bacterium]